MIDRKAQRRAKYNRRKCRGKHATKQMEIKNSFSGGETTEELISRYFPKEREGQQNKRTGLLPM